MPCDAPVTITVFRLLAIRLAQRLDAGRISLGEVTVITLQLQPRDFSDDRAEDSEQC